MSSLICNISFEPNRHIPVGAIVWMRGREAIAAGLLTDRFHLPPSCDRAVISQADYAMLVEQVRQAERQPRETSHVP